MHVLRRKWGKLPDGSQVHLFKLSNDHGMVVEISDYGGTVVSLKVPDKEGVIGDVVLGFSDLKSYLNSKFYFGCLIGRYANRIRDGVFKLNGEEVQVSRNEGENHLHGGHRGFDKVLWDPRESCDDVKCSLTLKHRSPDGDEGYLGTLDAWVIYTLTNGNELRIEYWAKTDAPTVVNLTNHSYFNLKGKGDILGHSLKINADSYTPVDTRLLPTGEIVPVKGTPLDFTESRVVGSRINDTHPQLRLGNGYDHNYVLGKTGVALRLSEPSTGRVLEVTTTQPGVQFYTGNFLDGSEVDRNGEPIMKHAGLCLETQHYPDSPNQPDFPSVALFPGETYTHVTTFKFSTV
ncbi:MAG: galactose mutarotase [Candidatus Bathyarchaeota archaeon]|nr:galactose mutarotase [Candidatus Bathyarchaeota archaeon]